MRAVVIEFQPYPEREWEQLGSVAEIEPLGSIQSLEPSGRLVILFGWSDGAPGVWSSMAGVDAANDAFRVVRSRGLLKLADLTEGPYMRTVHTASGKIKTRWRVESPGADPTVNGGIRAGVDEEMPP